MKDVFFSIIIPTLNEEHYLPHLLRDISIQQYENAEVIVVDGKSDDRTKEKAAEYKEAFPFHFLEVDKHNLCYQRNQGAAAATGKYLLFLDADARMPKDYLSQLERQVDQTKQLLYILEIDPERKTAFYELIFRFSSLFVKTMQKLHIPLTITAALLIEKNFFHKIHGFDETVYVAEDHNIVSRSYKVGVKGYFISHPRILFSMRRFDKDGAWSVMYKYLVFVTTMIFKGAVRRSSLAYDMGGQEFKGKK